VKGITTREVIQTLHESSGKIHRWGNAVDGSPILSVQCGGLQKPAVLVTAGVHAHEAGGVWAALKLIARLQTQQEVHILPLRDPFGFSGVNHCLSFAAGYQISLADHSGILTYLNAQARLIWQQEQMRCFQFGGMGFMWHPQTGDLEAFNRVNDQMTFVTRQNPNKFSTLFGKHVMLVNPAPYTEPGGMMGRCWHAWISTDGRWLNLNRGFGENEKPVEVAALQNALETIQPGLVIDLQEDDTDGFWFARPFSQSHAVVTSDLLSGVLEARQEKQFPLYHVAQMKADLHRDLEIPGYLQPDEVLPGVFWLNQNRLGQGENFLSYAADNASAIGVEAPLRFPLEQRVLDTVHILSTFITGWQQCMSSIKGTMS
jgi:hypothetical protein